MREGERGQWRGASSPAGAGGRERTVARGKFAGAATANREPPRVRPAAARFGSFADSGSHYSDCFTGQVLLGPAGAWSKFGPLYFTGGPVKHNIGAHILQARLEMLLELGNADSTRGVEFVLISSRHQIKKIK